jgi:hypothetical protein
VRPYGNAVGAISFDLYRRGELAKLKSFRTHVEEFYERSDYPSGVVFDRLHASSLSLFPESDWPDKLDCRTQPIILWCSIDATLKRVSQRGRDLWSSSEHSYFIEKFRKLAERYSLRLIDTSAKTPDAIASELAAEIQSQRAQATRPKEND